MSDPGIVVGGGAYSYLIRTMQMEGNQLFSELLVHTEDRSGLFWGGGGHRPPGPLLDTSPVRSWIDQDKN
jgi:hypothetical protein